MIAALTGPFIQAAGYSRGRRAVVEHLVVHTAEGSTEVVGLGNYFAGTTAGSSNAGLGQAGEYADYVTYNNTPWTNPTINSSSDTIELCAFARWTREQWLTYPLMLEGTARWIAWRAAVRGIPVIRQPDATQPGVHGHLDVSNTYRASDHTDPGDNFPWDVVISRAQQLSGPKVSAAGLLIPATVQEDTDMVVIYAPGRPTGLLADGHIIPLNGNDEVKALQAAGISVRPLNVAQFDAIDRVSKR